MSGMPSARGCEIKGKDALANFQKGFDNIPRDANGNMVVDPAHDPKEPEEPKYPRSCSVCSIRGYLLDEKTEETIRPTCPDSCGCQSDECKERFARFGGLV